MVKEALDGDTSADEDRRTPEYLRVRMHNGFETHTGNVAEAGMVAHERMRLVTSSRCGLGCCWGRGLLSFCQSRPPALRCLDYLLLKNLSRGSHCFADFLLLSHLFPSPIHRGSMLLRRIPLPVPYRSGTCISTNVHAGPYRPSAPPPQGASPVMFNPGPACSQRGYGVRSLLLNHRGATIRLSA